MSRAWQGFGSSRGCWEDGLSEGFLGGRREGGAEKPDVKATVQAWHRKGGETTGFVCGLRLRQVRSFLCGCPSL